MGRLTPIDIHQKEFSKAAFGYNRDEVENFLEMISVEFQSLIRENDDLENDVKEQAQIIDNYKNIEEDLKNTLILAQQSADEVRFNAVKESEILIKENELKVEKIIIEGQKKIDELEEKYNSLNRKYTSYKAKIKSDVKMLLEMIEEDDEEL